MASDIVQCNEAEEYVDNNYTLNEDEEVKKKLVREVTKSMKEKSINLLWSRLQHKTGKDFKTLWNEMKESTEKKLMSMLLIDDFLENVQPKMPLSVAEWLLFDLVLVHEKINVINFMELPQCINELYQQVQKYNVEDLAGDKLAVAWIRIALQFNKGGRQCSPMLLQLRWYQLKQLSRRQVFFPTQNRSRAVTKLLHAIAIRYQKVITQSFPTWEELINEERVILPHQFLKILNQGNKWITGLADEGWYLQINPEIHDVLMTCNYDIDNSKNTKTNAVPTTFGTETSEDHHECDSVYKEVLISKPKKAVDVPRKNRDPLSSNKNITATLNIDDEIDIILQKKLKTLDNKGNYEIGVGTNKNIEVKFKESAVKRKNNENEIDTEILDERKESVNLQKKKRQKMKSKKARPGCHNNDNTNDCIDPKLTMKVVVCMGKLEAMKVFKYSAYDSVNDNKVMECAVVESRPTRVSNDKIGNICQGESAVVDMDIDQSNNGIELHEHEKIYNKINYSSWLLQKPKNCKYNPIQTCNNPDFNIKLKKLAPAFYSSIRNNILLEKCKRLTIDLHKEFEKKLINGTIYVKDFKSDRTMGGKNVNHQVSHVIPAAPNHSVDSGCVLTVSDTNKISSEKSEKDIQKDMLLSLSTTDTSVVPNQCSSQTFCERRKIINLPNIDQIRKFNQSLLTAEVTPTLNNTVNNNAYLSRESNICEESIVVREAKVMPTVEVKVESLDDIIDEKNMLFDEPGKMCNVSNPGDDPLSSSDSLNIALEP